MSEDIIINTLNARNPKKGIPYTDWKIGTGSKMKIKIFGWLLNKSEDIYISVIHFSRWVYKNIPGLTNQLYYDIVVLGLKSISDRPKCSICGKYATFSGFGRGYLSTCSDSCFRQLRDTRMSDLGKKVSYLLQTKESRDKQRLSHLGWIPSLDYRKKASIRMKNFYKTRKGLVLKKKTAELVRARNISNLISETRFIKRKGKYVSGNYKSSKFNKLINYDSSWELNFIKYIEKLDDILIFDRCLDPIDYVNIRDNTLHKYVPDFFIKLSNNQKIVVEIKPASIVKNSLEVLSKKIAAKKYFKKKNIKYIILTEKELYETKKVRYSKLLDSIGVKSSFNIYDYIV